MKKIFMIVAAILLVSFAAIICITKFDKKDVIKNETKQSEISKNLEENKIEDNTVDYESDEKNTDEKNDVKPTTNKTDSNSTNSKNEKSNNSNTNNNNSNTNTNKNNNNNYTNNKKTNSQTPEPKKEEVITKSCTPKKFDMSFVRADFTSMTKCVEMGDKYKAIGYGYFCDFYPDDCGDTYYMLTLYERNTGIEFDFHNIELPN